MHEKMKNVTTGTEVIRNFEGLGMVSLVRFYTHEPFHLSWFMNGENFWQITPLHETYNRFKFIA